MNTTLRRLLSASCQMGINPLQSLRATVNLPDFISSARRYHSLNSSNQFNIRFRDLYPALGDRSSEAGSARGHYFFQDLWAARKIFAAAPTKHVDIGSRIDGFVSHLLVFRKVTVIDIRELHSSMDELEFIRDDATNLSRISDGSVESLSSLHAIEHFGLGRYGDDVNPNAWKTVLSAFVRVLSRKGRLYLSVPIGRERLQFNAHRIFSPTTIIEQVAPLKLLSFSAVDDQGEFHENASIAEYSNSNFSCGMFEFGKQ